MKIAAQSRNNVRQRAFTPIDSMRKQKQTKMPPLANLAKNPQTP
jgi:hypothetical protein